SRSRRPPSASWWRGSERMPRCGASRASRSARSEPQFTERGGRRGRERNGGEHMTEGGAHLSRYGRVVLKLSGEAFADARSGFGIDAAVVQRIADEVAAARRELGVEIAVVVGGGNIWRGMSGENRGMDRARADYMGMLATVINALALQDALEAAG